MGNLLCLHGLSDTLTHVPCIVCSAYQQHHKFLAPIAKHHVLWPVGAVRCQTGHAPQAVITSLVPVKVVELLEVVHIKQDEEQGLFFPLSHARVLLGGWRLCD